VQAEWPPRWAGQAEPVWQGEPRSERREQGRAWPQGTQARCGAQPQSYGACGNRWEGQAGQFYDPNQQYYDPNNPYSWQGAQMPGGGPPPKPAYKQWWFWTIIGIVVIGIAVLIFALLPGDAEGPNFADSEPTEQTAPAPTEPAESLAPTSDPEVEEPDPAEQPENKDR